MKPLLKFLRTTLVGGLLFLVPVVVVPTAAVGSIFTTLPARAKSANINGTQYYFLGATCFRPFFGNNGVYYQVVPSPI